MLSLRPFFFSFVLLALGIACEPCWAIDPSYFQIRVEAVAELLVTDPSGKQTGYNAGSIATGIPHSGYQTDAVSDLDTGAPDPNPTKVLSVRQPANGTYTIQVIGIQAGSYTVTVNAYNSDGSPQKALTFSGTASVGSVDTYTFQYTNATPPLASVSVTNFVAAGPGIPITVKGLGFNSTSVVRWSGTDLATTFVSPTQLTATVPAALLGGAGTAQITVITYLGPAPGTTNALTVKVNSPVPALTGLKPASILVGSPDFTLTVNGARFVPGAQVNWNGSALTTTWVSATNLTATVSASQIATVGTATITVTNPTPGGGTSKSLTFKIVPPTPSKLGLSKSSVIGGQSVTGTVTLTGPAGPAGLSVMLNSDNPAATLPASVTVAQGATTATFTVLTAAVSTDTLATISAACNGVIRSATLTIKAPTLARLTLTPNKVKGGASVTGKVTLTGVAAVDTVITLSTTNSAATVPASVTVSAGQTSASFTLTTVSPGSANALGTVTASLGTGTKSAPLTVTP